MAELHVSKKSIKALFSDMQGKKFLIPDYQRPYKWDLEKCETLWNDIDEFTGTAQPNSDYYLGTIVSFVNEDGNMEVIDGQQRITSFLLLLRAFYKKLEVMPQDEQVKGLKSQLAPCIWDIDRISQQVSDFSKIRIESKVATDSDNEVFHNILRNGEADEKAGDHYSRNFRYFKRKCDEYAAKNPLHWKTLCVTILQQCIILPIECNTQDTALTIFSTLNDRGLPLADSDIFKAQLYRFQPSESEKQDFTEEWKTLTETCKDSEIQIDDLFRYYSHVLRARSGDKTKEVGLRKFYAERSYDRLKGTLLREEIWALANFWWYVNNVEAPQDHGEEDYVFSIEAQKYLHILSGYANEFWKYATSVFFLKNKEDADFETKFELFLKRLSAFLFAKFLENPTVNAIKDDIYSACIIIQNKGQVEFNYKFEISKIVDRIDDYGFSKITRGLLLLHAYLHKDQDKLIPYSVEIEHIFPKKWQNTNYNGWSHEDAEEYLELFGNKVLFEKKLNIQAGNGYFNQKKARYRNSEVCLVKDLAARLQTDWLQEDITARNEEFKTSVLDFLEEQLS